MNDYIKHIGAGILAAVIVALPAYLDSSNQFDWRDLGCTIAGAAVVAVFIVAMHYGRG